MEKKQIVEYVWLGGSGWDFRSKARVLNTPVTSVNQIPEWNFDGSSTGQAETSSSEMILRPVRMVNDPFRGGHHKIVLCEVYTPAGIPSTSNFRHNAAKVFSEPSVVAEEFWFGVEQEYILCKICTKSSKLIPVAWGEEGNEPKHQGEFYCGVGHGKAIHREVPEEHLSICLAAGLDIAGINAEVFPGQWEYQVGICKGIDVCDQLWLSRYFLFRVCEKHKLVPSFDPKPMKGDWNGSGCHLNISTKSTREKPNKIETIEVLLNKMKTTHASNMSFFGDKNDERLTGKHETSNMKEFSWSVGGRHSSVRIPYSTEKGDTGYFEDRRPAANMDPYLTCAINVDSMLLEAKHASEFEKALKSYKGSTSNGVSH